MSNDNKYYNICINFDHYTLHVKGKVDAIRKHIVIIFTATLIIKI